MQTSPPIDIRASQYPLYCKFIVLRKLSPQACEAEDQILECADLSVQRLEGGWEDNLAAWRLTVPQPRSCFCENETSCLQTRQRHR